MQKRGPYSTPLFFTPSTVISSISSYYHYLHNSALSLSSKFNHYLQFPMSITIFCTMQYYIIFLLFKTQYSLFKICTGLARNLIKKLNHQSKVIGVGGTLHMRSACLYSIHTWSFFVIGYPPTVPHILLQKVKELQTTPQK